jgi:hypothetical protein
MLELKDFYDDQLVLRRVQRAEKEAARVNDDEDEEDLPPRGTQRNRPTQIDEEDDNVDIDDETKRRNTITRVKREKQQSRGLSLARAASSEPGDEVEAMDTD